MDLIAELGGSSEAWLARLRTAFHYIPFGAKSYQARGDEVDQVFSGVVYRQTLTFDYELVRHARTISVRVEPWCMVMYRDGLYLLGRRLDYGDQVMRVYAIDRMRDVHRDRHARFDVPSDFNPADHFGDLGVWPPDGDRERLELVFSPTAAVDVEARNWPGFVGWNDEPDGRRRMVLDLYVSVEVKQWICSFGADVEVSSPLWLRAWFRDSAEQLAQRYAVGKTSAPA